MSRGLGDVQREIKRMLTVMFDTYGAVMGFTDIRACFIAKHGGDPENGDRLTPTHERSLKRALKGLVDRGDVLVVGGEGGPGDPYRYTTIEDFAGTANGKKVKDTAHAKQIVAEMQEAVMKVKRADADYALQAVANALHPPTIPSPDFPAGRKRGSTCKRRSSSALVSVVVIVQLLSLSPRVLDRQSAR